MKVYTVQSPPTAGGPDLADPQSVVVIKEGLSWPALLFPLPWLLYLHMWLALIAYVVIVVALSALGEFLGGPLPPLAVAAFHLLFALEANQLRRRGYERLGYRIVGIAMGDTLEEAEIRYFAGREATHQSPQEPPPASSPDPVQPPPAPPPTTTSDVIGLFPAPESSPR